MSRLPPPCPLLFLLPLPLPPPLRRPPPTSNSTKTQQQKISTNYLLQITNLQNNKYLTHQNNTKHAQKHAKTHKINTKNTKTRKNTHQTLPKCTFLPRKKNAADKQPNKHTNKRTNKQYAVYRKFSPLSEAEKGDIFREAEREVSQMLQLNLLLTFHKSAAFAEVRVLSDSSVLSLYVHRAKP